MPKVKVIRMGETPDKYVRLVHYFQSEPCGMFHMAFADRESARNVYNRISVRLHQDSTMRNMVAIQRDCHVYVLKLHHAQEVKLEGWQ